MIFPIKKNFIKKCEFIHNNNIVVLYDVLKSLYIFRFKMIVRVFFQLKFRLYFCSSYKYIRNSEIMHIRRFHTHLYYIKRGVEIKKYVIDVSFQLYTIHILKFFFTYFKRVCPDHPIKLLMLVLFMFSVEGHTEHYTETRREIISYKTLITH